MFFNQFSINQFSNNPQSNKKALVCRQKNSSFANFGRVSACAICKCAVLCGGVSFFLRGEEKTK